MSTSMSGHDADLASQGRAGHNLRLIRILTAVTILLFFALAYLLQQQQKHLAEVLDTMCRQRQVNAQRSVAYYDGMIAIEQGNKFIDDELRQKRIKLFREAKPIIPTCPLA